MIEFSAGSGPDSRAIAIMLEESALDYRVASTGHATPAIHLESGVTETDAISGAAEVLKTLAKTSRRFLPHDKPARTKVIDRVQWTTEALAPTCTGGDAAAREPLLNELEQVLAASRFLTGEEITIADFCVYPLVEPLLRSPTESSPTPLLCDWINRLSIRPALARGYRAIE